MKVTAIVPSAGVGRRMKGLVEKPYLVLGDRPILVHTLLALARVEVIDEIVVVVSSASLTKVKDLIEEFAVPKIKKQVVGNATRTGSVNSGLQAVGDDTDIVLIHDGVRPFVSKETVEESVRAANEVGAAVAAVPVNSTIKKVAQPPGLVERTIDRTGLWMIQTPQTFRREVIFAAYRKAMQDRVIAGDDAALVERMNQEVKVIMGSYRNVKITTPEDLVLARMLLGLESRREE